MGQEAKGYRMKIKAGALQNHLEKGIPPLILIVGPEEFLRREAIEYIRDAIGQDAAEVERRSHKSPTESDLVELFDDLRTPSLFGGSRVVIAEPGEKWISANPTAWTTIAEEQWTAGHLIVVAESLDGRTKAAKALSKTALWIQVEKPFHRPPPWKPQARPWEHDLNRWIVSRASSQHLKIDPPTAHLLQMRIGTRLADLASILERLATVLRAGNKSQITTELIEEHTPSGEESTLFEVVDSLFLGDRAKALRHVRELLSRGSVDSNGSRTTDPTALLLQCLGIALTRARQIRSWHEIAHTGQNEEEIAKAIGVARPFIPRIQQQVRATPPPAVERLLDRLLRADCDLKGGAGPNATELLERIAAGV